MKLKTLRVYQCAPNTIMKPAKMMNCHFMLEISSLSYLVKMVKDGVREDSTESKDCSQLSGLRLFKRMNFQ